MIVGVDGVAAEISASEKPAKEMLMPISGKKQRDRGEEAHEQA